jgi:hypothetical protein
MRALFRDRWMAEKLGCWIGWVAAGILMLGSGEASLAEAPAAGDEIPLHERTEESLQEVGRQTYNPVSPLWQLTFDNKIVGLAGGGLDGVDPAFTGSFEPQGPVWQRGPGMARFRWAEDLGVYAQLTLPFIETVPVPRGRSGEDRVSGFGDIQLGGIIGPKRRSGFVWGSGERFGLGSSPCSCGSRPTTTWCARMTSRDLGGASICRSLR